MPKYKDGSEKITSLQAILYSWRGIKLLHKILPFNLVRNIVNNTLWGIMPLLSLFFSSLVISELAGGQDIQRIILFVSLAIGQGFVFSITSSFLTYLNASRGGNDSRYLEQLEFHKHYAGMDYVHVENAGVNVLVSDIKRKSDHSGLGYGLNRLSQLTPLLANGVISLVASAVLMSGLFVPFAGGSFITSPWVMILLIATSVVVPAVLQAILMKRFQRARLYLTKGLARSSNLYEYFEKTFVNAHAAAGKDVRIFNFQNPILHTVKKFFSAWLFTHNVFAQNNGIGMAVGAIFLVLSYLIIGLRALEGMYDIGEVVRLVGAITAFYGAIVGVMVSLSNLKDNAPFLGMLFDFFDLPSTKYKGTLTTEKRADGEYELEFHNVSFKYPGSDKFALENLNLAFRIGERIAIVGMNGSGKTTMIKLLCRLYEPTSGYISLNGIDIKKYAYDEYIDIFSVVFQDFALTGLPLGQNVATSINYKESFVRSALVKTGFGERLNRLENGLNTPLFKDYDMDGVTVSGGEAQKIALARAIYKNAPIVILDEPTAALDPIAEYEIYSKFNEIVGNKTAIFISHRLSSCRFCHDIAVFNEGKLVQQGTHEVLLSNTTGKYHEMWYAQAHHYGEG